MNYILFFTAFIGVFILLNMYISKRFVAKLDISQKTKRYLRIFLLINLVGILCYMLSRYYLSTPGWLYFLFSVPIGILFLLFWSAVVYDISRMLLLLAPISESRRKFFKKTLDVSSGAAALTLSLKAIHNARYVEIQKVEAEIKNLKQPYKIAQLSDLHIGGLIDKDFIEDIVRKVNGIKPDIVVITGDLIDVDIFGAKETLLELTKLNSKYGTYYIVGNHEYFHDIENIIESMKSLGIRVLENENVYIGEDDRGFNLAGVYDIFGYRSKKYIPNLQKALKDTKDAPTLLLAHQPRFIHEVADKVDLMLCGHTHGGQLFPFKFLVQLQQPYVSGLHRHNESLQIYVNKGTGFWGPPMRLGASSEITEMLIKPL